MTFYLFLPFAVVASRSFQPDPLMVFLFLASVFAIFSYHEQPSSFWMVASYVLSASAIFIKPVSLFGIYAVYVLLAIGGYGVKKTIADLRSILFIPITVAPALIFYLYTFVVERSMQDQAQASFLPQLLFTTFFWRGWLTNIHGVVGFSAFIVSLLGCVIGSQRGGQAAAGWVMDRICAILPRVYLSHCYSRLLPFATGAHRRPFFGSSGSAACRTHTGNQS